MVLIIGILTILGTVILHAMLTVVLIAMLKNWVPRELRSYGTTVRSFVVACSACALAFKHGIDIVLWAIVLWIVAGPQFPEFGDAVYFSSVTYTTLGYGDIVLTGPWRLLSAYEAINGMILFGVSTALLFVLFDYLWLREHER